MVVRVTVTMVRRLRGIHWVMTIALVIRGLRLGRAHLCLHPAIPSSYTCDRKGRLVH